MDAQYERMITVVVDAIEPDSDVIAADVHHAVCAEIISPPTLEEVEQVLDLLQMPGLRYMPGEVGWIVVRRLRDLEYLADPARAADPPPPEIDDRY
ncbi:hypothetical protein [Nocardia sp. NBC_01009]|uniref:hypothetical protein n=1 Tax=Nocardia sp. NBC_01009 TaxID=2975996 RepID=UPI003866C0C7|nr:hypothetical protein OHA42_04810 [Nocardia sp. NBC_01009]